MDDAPIHPQPRGRRRVVRVGSRGGIEVVARRREVPPTQVRSRQRPFEVRQVRVGGERGRGLERGDRSRVVADARPQAPDRAVQTDGIGVAEGERRLVMGDRVEVGEDLGGTVARLSIGLGGLRVATGRSLMAGDEHEPGEVVATTAGEVQAERLGHATMEEPSTSEARPLVREIAQRAVDEIEAGRRLPDEAAPHALVERVDGLLLGAAARVPQGRGIE